MGFGLHSVRFCHLLLFAHTRVSIYLLQVHFATSFFKGSKKTKPMTNITGL